MDNVEFRRSSYSGGSGNCVEVADTPTAHAVRDSKTPDQKPLIFGNKAWSQFLGEVKIRRL